MELNTPQDRGEKRERDPILIELDKRTVQLRQDFEHAIDLLVQSGKDVPKEDLERKMQALNSDYQSKLRLALDLLLDEKKAEAHSFNPFKAYQVAPKNWVRDMVITFAIINIVVWGSLLWRFLR